VGLLQTVVAVALFFLASLNSFTGSGWLAVSQLAGLILIKSSLPLFMFASAASRESLVQAANKQRQGDANRALALSVRRISCQLSPTK
jgi:O-antigen ligase